MSCLALRNDNKFKNNNIIVIVTSYARQHTGRDDNKYCAIIYTWFVFTTVAVLKFVPGHGAARLVPVHQTPSAADAARLVVFFYGRSGHVRHRDRGHAGKRHRNYYYIDILNALHGVGGNPPPPPRVQHVVTSSRVYNNRNTPPSVR